MSPPFDRQKVAPSRNNLSCSSLQRVCVAVVETIGSLSCRFRKFNPKVVVIDPITNFASTGTYSEVKSMVTRLIDMLKSRQITAMFTSLTSGDSSPELSEVGVS